MEDYSPVGDWDAFLLAGRYNLLEQGPIEDLLPKCGARSVSIVVVGAVNSAIIVGRNRPVRRAIAAKVKALGAICDRHGGPAQTMMSTMSTL
jgi:D-threo-aldose 1-dehydrogenase